MKNLSLCMLVLLIAACSRGPQCPQEAEYGRLDYYPSFESTHFAARDVLVWLPEDYSSDQKYAVLYMHDGQMLFDCNTSWNKQSWEIDSLANRLITDGRTKPFIVVGIDNDDKTRLYDYMPRRVYDYLPEEEIAKYGLEPGDLLSDNYLKFLVEELKPFIDSHYSTLSDAENTAVAGSSAGGLISLYAQCEYPEVFGASACLSTHTPMVLSEDFQKIAEDAPLWSKSLRDYVSEHGPEANSVKLYMDCGDQTMDSLYPEYQQKMDSLILSLGWDEQHYMSKVYAGHHHDEKSWKSRFDIALSFLFPAE